MDNIKNDEYYVKKILKDLLFIVKHMNGVEFERFEEDELLLNAMLFCLIQVQENSKKLTDEYKAKRTNIPWVDIAGLRNRIVHDYGNVDLHVVYSTLTEDVPWLISEIEK